MNVKVSVIVPIYNVEEYLPQCLDSIINQTYKDFEIILVNDGSTDLCGEICDMYQKRDERIRCIQKLNGGLVSARKAGISDATGDYVLFVDSDDWIDSDEIEMLVRALEQNDDPDVIVFGLIEEYTANYILKKNGADIGRYEGRKLSELKQRILMTDIFFEWKILPNLCCKLIKTGLLKKAIYHVPDTISYAEDAVCGFPCMLNAASIYVCDYTPYHYRQREGSIVREQRGLSKRSFKEVYNILYKAFDGMENNLRDLRLYMFFILMLKGYSYLTTDEFPLFPYSGIEKNSRLVIYCAGGFGRILHKHISTLKQYTVVGWADTMAEQYRAQGYDIQTVDEVLKTEFDYILIAILKESTAEQIAGCLCEKGVPMHKVKYIKKETLQEMALPEWLGR